MSKRALASLTIVLASSFEPLHSGGFLGRNELNAVLLVAPVKAVIFAVAYLLRSDARKFGAEKKVARAPTAVQLVGPNGRWSHGE